MNKSEIIDWLLSGDVSIQYQAQRDLLGHDLPELQAKISTQGWGAKYLARQNPDGHWGRKYYQPKWTSTHYTLLDIKNLGMPGSCPVVQQTIDMILNSEKGSDGGIRPISANNRCDVCLNGMFLNFAAYFGASQSKLKSVIDFILDQTMPDGGFNCLYYRRPTKHSSVHSTISILEGIYEYQRSGYVYRRADLRAAQRSSEEFLLNHKLYKSHQTGEIINQQFLQFHYPTRWHYDILRALDYFAMTNFPNDPRMSDALEILINKRQTDGRWKLPAKYPGVTHFEMETAGQPSRWNTLRAFRVLTKYRPKTVS